MAEIVIVSGFGPYADPWHRFAETSQRLAEILQTFGHAARIRDDVEAGLAQPGRCDVLVVNIGNPTTSRPLDRMRAAAHGMTEHLEAGRALLGIHVSATSLTQMPQWPLLLGGRWNHGHSMHPPIGPATVHVRRGEHPIVASLDDFDVFDERYSYLETAPDVSVLCEHQFEGVRHPLAWARQSGPGRVVYDALGHDVRSYDSASHVELLRRSVGWLLGDP